MQRFDDPDEFRAARTPRTVHSKAEIVEVAFD
jgi:hypothetical protein